MLEKIVSIKKVGTEKTRDITVTGNHLFYANGILTHNSGYDNSDISMTDTADSMGTVHTADFILAISPSEELDKIGQVLAKQLKNRYGDLNKPTRFVVGVDKAKMRLYNVSESEQDSVSNESAGGPADTPAPSRKRGNGADEGVLRKKFQNLKV